MNIKLCVISLVFTAQVCAAGSIPPVDLLRAVAISDIIMDDNLEDVSNALIKFTAVSTEPISIVINSPGGSVIAGFLFINNMEAVRAKGIHLRCYVNSVAASMAFQILTHCDERYALSRSFLLWHRVRTRSDQAITAPLAISMAAALQDIDNVIVSELYASLAPLSHEVIMHHLEQETLHIGMNLASLAPAFIKVAPSIPGLMEAFEDSRVAKSRVRRGLFNLSWGPGEIVYIMSSHGGSR